MNTKWLSAVAVVAILFAAAGAMDAAAQGN